MNVCRKCGKEYAGPSLKISHRDAIIVSMILHKPIFKDDYLMECIESINNLSEGFCYECIKDVISSTPLPPQEDDNRELLNFLETI